MKKWITYSLIGLLSVGLFSCQDEDNDPAPSAGKEMTVRLELPARQVQDGPATYAMPADEEKIEHIAVLAFKTDPAFPDDVDKGIFLYRAGVSYNRSNPTSCVIKVQEMDDAQTFVIIANARDTVDNATLQEGDTKAAVIQKLTMTQATAFDSSTMTSIPMWGEVGNKVVKSGTVPNNLTCKLYRMLAKINVKVDAGISSTDFTLRSVRLYMPRQKGAIIPGNWSSYTGSVPGEPDKAVVMPTEPAKETIPKPATSYLYTTTTGSIQDRIYTFEARNAGSPAVDMPDKACLVVGGWYNNDKTKEYYYRLDLKSGATQLDILRNFIYNVTITGVGGIGVEDPDDAYEGLSVIEASVEPWNPVTGDVQYGNSHLYVSQRYLWLNPDGTTEPFAGSKVLKIKSSEPKGWRWKTEDPTTAFTLKTFNVTTSGGAMNVETTVAWAPGTSLGRDGEATIIAGDLEYKVYFIQDNCGRRGIPLKQNIGGGRGEYLTHRFPTGTSIVGQCWMVENLRYGTKGTANTNASALHYNDGGKGILDNWSYSGTDHTMDGYYYTWKQGIKACPSDTTGAAGSDNWVMPSQIEWKNLENAANSGWTAYKRFWGENNATVVALAGTYSIDREVWHGWGNDGYAYWWGSGEPNESFGISEGGRGMIGPFTGGGFWQSVRCLRR